MSDDVKVGPLTAYVAYNSPGEPVCLYVTKGPDDVELASVSIYERAGEIIGVGVYNGAGQRVVGTGFLPVDDEYA